MDFSYTNKLLKEIMELLKDLNIDKIFDDWDEDEVDCTDTIIYSTVYKIDEYDIILDCKLSRITERRIFDIKYFKNILPLEIGEILKIILKEDTNAISIKIKR